MKHPATRKTIYEVSSELLSRQDYACGQFLFRLQAPVIASLAKPGSFVHLQCDPSLPLRRPFSIMRADPDQGWIDILFKVCGNGTRLLATRSKGDNIDLLGPIGRPFQPDPCRRKPLLIGGGVGIPPMIFLAEHFRKKYRDITPLVIMGSEIPFPFRVRPSQILLPGMPVEAIAGMSLLDDWGIPSRLATLQGYAGCFDGYVTELAEHWLQQLGTDQLDEVEIFACGPEPMLAAVAQLSRTFHLPCQVSMEEYMACGVGGCAGCTIRVETANGPAMKRVCVDGPVFDATAVFPFS